MNELAARKRLLVKESELNRETLMLEFSAIGQKTARLERWFALGLKAYPLLRGAITLGRSLRGSRANRSGGLIATLGKGLGLARAVLGLVRKPAATSPSADGH